MRPYDIITHPSAKPRIDAGWASEMIVSGMRTARTWIMRQRQRHDLALLDNRLLQDIGLSRIDVKKEAEKPFWQG